MGAQCINLLERWSGRHILYDGGYSTLWGRYRNLALSWTDRFLSMIAQKSLICSPCQHERDRFAARHVPHEATVEELAWNWATVIQSIVDTSTTVIQSIVEAGTTVIVSTSYRTLVLLVESSRGRLAHSHPSRGDDGQGRGAYPIENWLRNEGTVAIIEDGLCFRF